MNTYTDTLEALEASIQADAAVTLERPFWTEVDTSDMTLLDNVELARDFPMIDGMKRVEGIYRGEWFKLDISTQY
jgi:hypothetical protein